MTVMLVAKGRRGVRLTAYLFIMARGNNSHFIRRRVGVEISDQSRTSDFQLTRYRIVKGSISIIIDIGGEEQPRELKRDEDLREIERLRKKR